MIDIILVDSRDKLDKVISRSNPKHLEVVLVSSIITPDMVDKEFTVHDYEMLIPPHAIINQLIAEGDGGEFEINYITYLKKPATQYLLNMIVYRAVTYDMDIVIACAADEQEFKYLPFIGEMIEDIYGISILPYKKWKKGHRSHIERGREYVADMSLDIKHRLEAKLSDSRVELPMHRLIRFGKYHLSQMSKPLKKKWKRMMEEL